MSKNNSFKTKLAKFFCLYKETSEKQLKEEANFHTLQQRADFLKSVYDGENQRRRAVEHKASLLISSLSMMGAVIMGVVNFNLHNSNSINSCFIIIYAFILAISLCFSIGYAISALHKSRLYFMFVNDQENVNKEDKLYVKLIKSYERCIIFNQKLINDKIDLSEKSQHWFYLVLFSISGHFTNLLVISLLNRASIYPLPYQIIILLLVLSACAIELDKIYHDDIVQKVGWEEDPVLEAMNCEEKNVCTHINDAWEKANGKSATDFSESIKESLRALDEYLKNRTQKDNITSALEHVEHEGVKIPIFLKTLINEFYVHEINNEEIHYPLLDTRDESVLSSEEAIFTLVACCSLMNYLRIKILKNEVSK